MVDRNVTFEARSSEWMSTPEADSGRTYHWSVHITPSSGMLDARIIDVDGKAVDIVLKEADMGEFIDAFVMARKEAEE